MKIHDSGVILKNGKEIQESTGTTGEGTIAYSILKAHDRSENSGDFRIRFD